MLPLRVKVQPCARRWLNMAYDKHGVTVQSNPLGHRHADAGLVERFTVTCCRRSWLFPWKTVSYGSGTRCRALLVLSAATAETGGSSRQEMTSRERSPAESDDGCDSWAIGQNHPYDGR
jgi:hypothetical protein